MPDQAWITGVGLADVPAPGRRAIDLFVQAGSRAVRDAALGPDDIDGLVTGYSLVDDALMPADATAEALGTRPSTCFTLNAGGATGTSLLRQAELLIRAGRCRHVLVAWADNRASGASQQAVVSKLAGVGHPDLEAPLAPTIPALYALHATRYLAETGATAHDLAEIAVAFRRHAARNPAAHKRAQITTDDVRGSPSIAVPLTRLDCCLITDFGAALVVSATPGDTPNRPIAVAATAEGHAHEHLLATARLGSSISGRVATEALVAAGRRVEDLDLLMVYDSFTITAAIQLEELGIAPAGSAGAMARDGAFDLDGTLPVNTNGGMLSAINGGIHLVAEAVLQLQGRATGRQVSDADLALVNGIGGILSSHVAVALEGAT